MKNSLFPILLTVFSSLAVAGPLSFTQAPIMTADTGASWRIDFAVSDSTDVEVSIVDRATGDIVRHLAAGMLGSGAPAPLVKNSLSQTLTWDGRDDYLQRVASTATLTVRVRATISVELDRAAGGDPYIWSGTADPAGTYFYGITKGSDGSVFVTFHPASTSAIALRQYSASGDYIKTLFPIPGDRPVADYSGWGLNLTSPSSYSPKTTDWYGPLMTTSPLGTYGSAPNFVINPAPGQLGILADKANTLFVINEDGTCNASTTAATRTFIASPAIKGGFSYGISGPRFFAGAPDRSYFLMAGVCNSYGADTGFYRDGRIFKVDMTTRAATIFHDLDTAQSGNSVRQTWIHGVAVDTANNVFACDRLHGRILVIDKDGALVKSFTTLAPPDDITWCREDGALYATGRSKEQGVFLYKITDWKSDTSLSASQRIYAPGTALNYLAAGWSDRTFLSTAHSPSEGILVWLAYRVGGVVIFKENAGAFSEFKSFRKTAGMATPNLKRMVLDPKTETAYLVSSGTQVHQISNWSDPVLEPCSTLTGTVKRSLTGFDLAVDPRRRHLFVRQIGTKGPFEGDIYRYSMGPYLTPAPLTRLNTHLVVDSFCNDGTMSVGTADYGFAVAPNGDLAALSKRIYCASSGGNSLRYYPLKDTQSAYRVIAVDTTFTNQPGCAGVRFDLQGNIYVGRMPAPTITGLPSILRDDASWKKTMGGIHRYAPTGAPDGELFTGLSAVDKIYNVDFGQFGAWCDCMTALFGIDGWGRLYAPNGVFQKITVLDNAGNWLARFGNYGNNDDVAREGAGMAGTAGKCYMAYPFCVDASDHFIYVADPGNLEILRYRKTFELDNMPNLAADLGPALTGPLSLSVAPNPLASRCRVLVTLPAKGEVALEVIDPAGRLVDRIAAGSRAAGRHAFAWDGSRRAAGVYILRLQAQGGVLTRRLVLMK